MKNVLGCVYTIRIFISLGFLFLLKTAAFAFIATSLLGISGDATVPPTSGIISHKFGPERMAVLYGFTLVGHQIGAFLSSSLGGMLVKAGMGYAPLWAVNLCLEMCIRDRSIRSALLFHIKASRFKSIKFPVDKRKKARYDDHDSEKMLFSEGFYP